MGSLNPHCIRRRIRPRHVTQLIKRHMLDQNLGCNRLERVDYGRCLADRHGLAVQLGLDKRMGLVAIEDVDHDAESLTFIMASAIS